MAALMLGAFAGFAACGDDDEKDNPTTYEESTMFAFHYDGQKLSAGATIDVTPSMQQQQNDFANLNFYVENKTDATVNAAIKAERIEGRGESQIELCFNGACRQINLGAVNPFVLEAGVSEANVVTYDYWPSAITSTTVYRITVGEGSEMKNPQVVFLKHNI